MDLLQEGGSGATDQMWVGSSCLDTLPMPFSDAPWQGPGRVHTGRGPGVCATNLASEEAAAAARLLQDSYGYGRSDSGLMGVSGKLSCGTCHY